tara:strand:- start:18 stop:191 length:174 start_codon:yes stop_codon:yes gene_type:complete
MSKYIGKEVGLLSKNGISFKVTIKDVKQVYGKTRYLIEPVSGSGSVWCESTKLCLDE